MPCPLTIRPLTPADIPTVTAWARQEGFAPGEGDVAIYRQTDQQGLWVAWLDQEPVGCIAGVRYNAAYGFIGMFLVAPHQRGKGYGVELWRHALHHLEDVPCIGLEAALDRVDDYGGWGFQPGSPTTRWQRAEGGAGPSNQDRGLSPGETSTAPVQEPAWCLLTGEAIPEMAVQRFDAQREPSPRPHFLHQWLHHPAGTVHALLDREGTCHGFPNPAHVSGHGASGVPGGCVWAGLPGAGVMGWGRVWQWGNVHGFPRGQSPHSPPMGQAPNWVRMAMRWHSGSDGF
jgi:ribosomal-protein-alanine N-acetyltransferase